MRLHELVELKNKIKNYLNCKEIFNLSKLENTTKKDLALVSQFDFPTEIQTVLSSIDTISKSYESLTITLQSLLAAVDDQINSITKDYLKVGYLTKTGEAIPQLDPIQERSIRDKPVSPQIKEQIIAVIFRSTSDDYPALEIGPGDGTWTDYLVAGDPLYLVDRHQEFLDSTKSKYPDVYQRRLRLYKLGHGALPDSDFSALPENQFRFIFSWNVFNYFPLDYTTSFLRSCYNLLRPGGNMLFSFNNCDNPICAKYVEIGYASWMPEDLMRKTVLDLGFEIAQLKSMNDWSWIEIRKPGTLQTVKVHQSLGEIVKIPR